MASNLRKKIPKESTLYVNDVDTAAVDRFVQEHTSYGPVKALPSAKAITEHSVIPPIDFADRRTLFLRLCQRGTMSKLYIWMKRRALLPPPKRAGIKSSSR
jgi:hypothetical protein